MLFSVIVKCIQVVKGIALCVFFIKSTCLEYWDAEGVKKKIEGRKKNKGSGGVGVLSVEKEEY